MWVLSSRLNHYSKYNRAVVFAPDHGAHFDSQNKCGMHGKDIPEDMELRHFYAIHGKGWLQTSILKPAL
jgi:hypothetical protein